MKKREVERIEREEEDILDNEIMIRKLKQSFTDEENKKKA